MTAHLPPHAGWPGQEPTQWGPPPTPPKKRKRWPWILGGIVLLFVLVGVVNAGNGGTTPATQNRPGTPSGVDSQRYDAGWAPQAGGPIEETRQQASAAPSGPLTVFGAGTYEVGTGDGQVAPGKYKTQGPEDGDHSCYWARLKNTDGDLESIVANGNAEGPTVVTVGPRDGAFETRCQWTRTG